MKKQYRFATVLSLMALAMSLSLAAVATPASPDNPSCSTNSENRQFDFWLGQWDVSYPGAAKPSASKVSLELNKCMIVENWVGAKGHTGKNMFAYSADDNDWHGMFADNQGRVHIFEGTVTDGKAEFTGPSRGARGEAILNRIKVVRVSPDTLEQTWEKSSDNGSTWHIEFQGTYSRRKT